MSTDRCPQFSESEFKKSSHCVYPPGGCVEAAVKDGFVAVRDAKNPGVTLVFNKIEWQAFVEGVKAGEFDAK